MNGVEVKGPCKAPIEVQVDGTIQAPADPSQMKAAEMGQISIHGPSYLIRKRSF